jgi:hypothetical protein
MSEIIKKALTDKSARNGDSLLESATAKYAPWGASVQE